MLLDSTWDENTLQNQDGTGQWIGMQLQEYELTWSVQPNCANEFPQTLSISHNGMQLADHTWQTCEPWGHQISIPPEQVIIGFNVIDVKSNTPLVEFQQLQIKPKR